FPAGRLQGNVYVGNRQSKANYTTIDLTDQSQFLHDNCLHVLSEDPKFLLRERRKAPVPAPGGAVNTPDGVRFSLEILHIDRAYNHLAGLHGPIGNAHGLVAGRAWRSRYV